MARRRVWNPADETFRIRLAYMLDARGISGVQSYLRQRGTPRSRRSIRSWLRSGGPLPSADIRRGVARTGRRETGPAEQTRPGQPGFILDPRAAALRRSIEERDRRQRRRMLEQARTPAERRRAEAMPTEVDPNMIRDFSVERQDLIRREQSGEAIGPGTQLSADWDEWRRDVERESPGGGMRGRRQREREKRGRGKQPEKNALKGGKE